MLLPRLLGCGFVSLCLITEAEGPSETVDVESQSFNHKTKHVYWFLFLLGLLVTCRNVFEFVNQFWRCDVQSYFVVLFVRTILFAYFVDSSTMYFIRVYLNKRWQYRSNTTVYTMLHAPSILTW